MNQRSESRPPPVPTPRWPGSPPRGDSPDGAAPRPALFRQGDVLLVGIDRLPDAATPEPRSGRIVLAEGEATGHAHAIHEPDARSFTHEGERYLLTRSKARLIHEEHATIEVPTGQWRIIIQREYDPDVDTYRPWRTVLD